MNEITLNKFKYYAEHRVSRLLLERGFDEKVITYEIADEIAFQIEKAIYGRRVIHSEDVEFKTPENWFEHLKKNLGFKYKETVKTAKIQFDCRALFPELEGMDHQIKIKRI